MHRATSAFFAFFTLAVLSACTHGNPTTVRTGPGSATGVVIPVDVSLVRRGTHALVINGKTQFYLESKKENLQAYEGQTVFVRGTLESNFRSEDLPVMIVEFVNTAYGHEPLHAWEVPALNLSINAPETWDAKIEKGIVSFSLKNETSPLLTVSLTSSGSLPPGTSLYVAGHRGVRTTTEKNVSQDVFIEDNGSVIHLHFDASTQTSVKRVEEGQILLSQFENLLSSLKFLTDQSSSSQLTGTGSETPCGGIAGVLCPSGYFCDITDPQENIGQCRHL